MVDYIVDNFVDMEKYFGMVDYWIDLDCLDKDIAYFEDIVEIEFVVAVSVVVVVAEYLILQLIKKN